MKTFSPSIILSVCLICATILAATVLVCLTFKDYDRYCRFGDNGAILDKRTGVAYTLSSEINYRAATRLGKKTNRVGE